MSIVRNPRRQRPRPPLWLSLAWIALAICAPDSRAEPLDLPPNVFTAETVRDLSPARDRFQTQAQQRRAELRYRATRIDVREDDSGEVGFFLGDSKVKLAGADFFDRVGREDLAAEFRSNAGVLNLVTFGGLSTAVASEGAALGVLIAGLAVPELFGSDANTETTVMLSLATGGLLLAVAGFAVGIGSMGFDPSPTTSEANAALAHDYNRRLRRELNLSDDDHDSNDVVSACSRAASGRAAVGAVSLSPAFAAERNRQPLFASNTELQE